MNAFLHFTIIKGFFHMQYRVTVVRGVTSLWKSTIGVLSAVISSTKTESWEMEHFHIFFYFAYNSIRWQVGCQSRKQKERGQPIKMLLRTICDESLTSKLSLKSDSTVYSLGHKRRTHKGKGLHLLTPSIWFSLDHVALCFWWLRLCLRW